jgi:hypothetical protein
LYKIREGQNKGRIIGSETTKAFAGYKLSLYSMEFMATKFKELKFPATYGGHI